nr:transposase [Serratia symbiotica]
MAIPGDQNGSFEPHLVKKHQTTLSDKIERKIIGICVLGMSYKDISQEIEDLYAFSVSSATLSAVLIYRCGSVAFYTDSKWLDRLHTHLFDHIVLHVEDLHLVVTYAHLGADFRDLFQLF